MADFSSTLYTAQAAGRSQAAAPGLHHSLYLARAQVAVTTALAANDTLSFMQLPDGAIIEDMEVISDQIDSSGSPTFTLNLGDSGSATRFGSALVVGRTADSRVKMKQSGMGYQLTAKTLILGTVQAAAATKVAGNVTLLVYYKMLGKATS